MNTRRAQFERGWIVVSIAYGGLRAGLVWKFLRKYGVNPYAFGFIEFASAAVYGKSSAQVVGAVIDGAWSRLRWWLPIAVLAFFAPDGYVFFSAGSLPSDMMAILISVVSVSLVLSGLGVVTQVRRGRQAKSEVG